ncbi:rhomboid family intramembrane serine protease [Corynebacterium uberis]|uniref:rhomboid family intramembrane serine protease n=1 Tax=Corynebacterium TaxID=1716 RepID=UPI001D0AC054|nr:MULTISPECIES: rhomboid family intramembrane serine protease [Corynebacterium]MCZ9310126.1 rhomboid family intramembrane serine protease [Corynebacterium sp. c6VSa_13]UDL73268.1 rhomboid family intramembrane serine protease [Corynebacterium uberis]UDL75855.1 rhomboid family intramembrane serine protease [Corynebacterium uberis]UDL80350.1 rhomboid family intramembrane serine protease [Corynebacterium uberis]UDL82486.1 rhomboid family intramembrane serine protease [Corynebacterium uberis]
MSYVRSLSQAPVTAVLTGIIVVVWVVTAVQAGSAMEVAGSSVAESWILYGPAVATQGAGLWRVVGNMFIHLGLPHMVLNGFMLVVIGPVVERAVGSALFGAIFLVSGLGASAAVLAMNPLTPTAGASGALYGLMAVLVGLAVRGGGGSQLGGALSLVGVNVVYTLMSPGVSLWGHAGGLITGAVIAVVIVVARSRGVRAAGVAGVGVVVVGLLAWLVASPVVALG